MVSILNRAIYAFFSSVIIVGILMIIDMIFSIGIGDFIFSERFFIPLFVIAYLVTPYVARRIKFDTELSERTDNENKL